MQGITAVEFFHSITLVQVNLSLIHKLSVSKREISTLFRLEAKNTVYKTSWDFDQPQL